MSRQLGYLLGVLFACIILSLPQVSYGATAYGTLKVVKGKVKVISAKTGKTKRARLGQRVSPGDTIITAKDSRVKIVMVDKNVINISPDSQVVFEKYEFEPKANKKNVLLKVLYGKVRAKVEQKYNEKSNRFQIKTPSAVAGVRGTDFFTSYNPVAKSTKIVTFKGRVAFGLPGPNGAILNPVMVKVGQFTTNIAGVKPIPPIKVPKQELVKLDVSSDADKGAGGNSGAGRVPAGNDGASNDKSNDDQPKQDGEPGQPGQEPSEQKGENGKGNKNGQNGGKGPGGPGAPGMATGGGPDGAGAPGDSMGGPIAGGGEPNDGGFRGPASDGMMQGPDGGGFAPGDCSMCTMDDISIENAGATDFFGGEFSDPLLPPIFNQIGPDQEGIIRDIVENIISDGTTQLTIRIVQPQ